MTLLIACTVPGLRVKNGSNTREHWGETVKRKKHTYRVVGESYLSAKGRAPITHPPYLVVLTRVGPAKMDPDGLATSFKHVQDEVAARLGVDDGDDSAVSWRYAQEKGPYAVRVEVYQRAQLPGGAFWSRNPPTLCCDIKALYPAADLKREAKQFSAVDDPNPPVKAALLKREATCWKVLGAVVPSYVAPPKQRRKGK